AGDADLMVQLEERGELPIRVYNALVPEALDDLIARKIWSVNDGKVETRAVKFYVDGALGSRGAALAAPYADDPSSKGLLLISEQDAKAAWQKALDNGIQVTTHAIGDRGNALVLQWYTDVLRNFNNKDYPRWRIEHAQIVNPDDYHLFYDLGVIASMQPSHAIGDLHFAPDRLGMDRLNGAYAWRSLMDADAILVGGSDAPVERGDPMVEFYAAVAREDLTGFSGPGWHPEEVLTREEALRIFTYNPAIASYNEDKLGQLKIGRKADISIFSANIMTIEADQIPLTKAVMTIVDGEIVFEGK
ncbi:MAG: amidohydrolase family protein, partial [Parvularculaceae bacterium]